MMGYLPYQLVSRGRFCFTHHHPSRPVSLWSSALLLHPLAPLSGAIVSACQRWQTWQTAVAHIWGVLDECHPHPKKLEKL